MWYALNANTVSASSHSDVSKAYTETRACKEVTEVGSMATFGVRYSLSILEGFAGKIFHCAFTIGGRCGRFLPGDSSLVFSTTLIASAIAFCCAGNDHLGVLYVVSSINV